MKVLALSSSRVANGGYLESAAPLIQELLGTEQLTAAFISFALVDRNYDYYGATVQQALSHLPYTINFVTEKDPVSTIQNADAIMVGGGNTFKLLHDLYHFDLVHLIQEKVSNGSPYIGWSAGSNITGLTLSTTNDMPIIQPKSFKAFGFLPFQINPHYLNQQWEGFHGETRDQRLEEFVKLNPQIPVVGLPEGTALQLQDSVLQYVGITSGVLFQDVAGSIKRSAVEPGSNLSFLL
jgi:dipeptidase E